MKLKAVLFDFDGTLVQSIDLLVGIFAEVLREQKLPVPPKKNLRRLIGRPMREIFEKIVPGMDTAAAEKRFREIEATKNNAANIALVADARKTLEFLRARNIRLGIVSTKRVPVVETLARELEIWQFFDLVVGRDLISKPKPDPEPIFFACEKMGISPREILFVGDSLLDLRAAKNAGAPFVGVLTGVTGRIEFQEKRADYIFSHVGALANLVRELKN